MTNILIGEIFKELAQIQEDIGNLNMSVTAQHLALADLVPDFESRYQERMRCAEVLELRSECERRIQNLYEAHRKLSSRGQSAYYNFRPFVPKRSARHRNCTSRIDEEGEVRGPNCLRRP